MNPELANWLTDGLVEARRAWPEIEVDDDVFRQYLVGKVDALPDQEAFRKLRVADLYLTVACLNRDHVALVAFEERYFPKIERLLARLNITSATAEDLLSTLREALFFGQDGSRPQIGDYSGRGDLASWLRSIAIRLGFKSKKKQGREVEPDENLDDLATESTPELLYLRQAHASAFESAIAEALGSLDARGQNLLRQHYLDGLTVDALAKLHHVHRTTLTRQLAAARERVLDHVKASLSGVMSPSELESFLRATRPDLDSGISAYLRSSQ